MSAVDSAEALSSGVDMLVFPWAKAGTPNTRDTSVTVSSFMEFLSPLQLWRASAPNLWIAAASEVDMQ